MMKTVIKARLLGRTTFLLIPALLVVAGLPANAKENDGTVRGNGSHNGTSLANLFDFRSLTLRTKHIGRYLEVHGSLLIRKGFATGICFRH